jgi:threonine synthase
MKFHSTNNKQLSVDAKQAVLEGLAPDKGLYMPHGIPRVSDSFLDALKDKSLVEIAFEVSRCFFSVDIPDKELRGIAQRALTFDAPLIRLNDNLFVLELFHGPTLAFKDFAAHYMAQLISYFRRGSDRELTILVATSGDTGGAVARGFFCVKGVRVVVLYPSGKVTPIQEKQLTTLGENIFALEVDGAFDDCQRMVKEAFVDSELSRQLDLTSANSINIARLIPQSFYYFYGVGQLSRYLDRPNPIISVPSGNFGNLTAGLFAKQMGLPVARFIASTNSNNTFVEYLRTGNYVAKPSIATISNAMDVGDPSNFVRILDLYNGSHESMRKHIFSASFSDKQTKQEIKELADGFGYISDPHTAVGFLGVKAFREEFQASDPAIVVSTAHPIKFIETMQEVIPGRVQRPQSIEELFSKEKTSTKISSNFGELKSYLLSLS